MLNNGDLDQLEQMQKIKVKVEKDKQQIQRELEDATQTADSELRGRQEAEKVIKNLELQLAELQSKADEQSRLLSDFASLKSRLHNENADLEHQVEDLENQSNSLHRLKSQLVR